ncbi:peptidyl-prolyl cis-trans isomerase PASTICCINO1-like isoform X1 [Pistacia vera]|uniref:peptidyl-prolyl cis-trans isomerase PASTICCINO1-like isoform X1 n=1 Tax=Pistacia vera TaxID=55513 RepID=UPI0012631168|nr:peptidyl-prolyl cis-trans isomerase PASTICCINO1-like isoform X1 [Pistacia vera]XP_031277365.1 peptidyl-prolyl cis-trans isomerase PASTICCINO1-like isoform X1 [Pistacia vera]XP_031277366.1 peptidyl-prolyl cis-trans isomerase PASTICCINO1-like isoform X1 [Pistacia vera]
MALDDDTDVSQKKNKAPSEDEKRRKKIVPGSLMKAVIRPGGGDSTPSEGDQVIYHCTVRTLDGVIVESTRLENGGKGIPRRLVLGKSKMILGLLEGIPTMLKGEVSMFKMKSEMHYGEDDCPMAVPGSFPKDEELHFEIEMIDFSKAKVVADDLGVLKKVINEGQGWESPRQPYEVKAWISAKTGDGKLIFSHTEGEPYFFTFGRSEVPKGLEMGIGTMTREEKAVIYVTSQYLTQSPLLPVVDGYEEIHFEVELVHFIQVRDMLGDGRLIKRRLRDGKGEFPMDCPLHDSLLRVHYKGMLLNEEKRVFYDTRVDNDGQPLEFSSGEGRVPEGFEMCVRLMLPGELALVTCPPDYAYDKFPRPENVPVGAHIQWEIELLGFEMPKDWTGLTFENIMDEAEKIRVTGNRLFKEGKFELAKAKYEKVLREFNHVNPQDDEEGKVFVNTRNLLHLNVAACFLKMGECRKSIEACNKVLDANPAHVKALYRRGMAYMAVGDFEEARSDFEMMMKVDKSSEPDATAALSKLKKTMQELESKAKKQFKGLFDKNPGEIADAGTENDDEDEAAGENEKDVSKEDSDGDETREFPEPAAEAPRMGGFYRFWPTSGRLFSALGLQRCTIL